MRSPLRRSSGLGSSFALPLIGLSIPPLRKVLSWPRAHLRPAMPRPRPRSRRRCSSKLQNSFTIKTKIPCPPKAMRVSITKVVCSKQTAWSMTATRGASMPKARRNYGRPTARSCMRTASISRKISATASSSRCAPRRPTAPISARRRPSARRQHHGLRQGHLHRLQFLPGGPRQAAALASPRQENHPQW